MAAATVMTSKVVKALVGIIDELGARGKQGLTADEQKKQVLRQAGRHWIRPWGQWTGCSGKP